jgi:rhamnulokinase/L-fuculokinase
MASESTGLEVQAGPVEATAIGNIIVQLVARGEISNLSEGRKVVKASFDTLKYLPKENGSWNEQYSRFKEVLSKKK